MDTILTLLILLSIMLLIIVMIYIIFKVLLPSFVNDKKECEICGMKRNALKSIIYSGNELNLCPDCFDIVRFCYTNHVWLIDYFLEYDNMRKETQTKDKVKNAKPKKNN